MKRFIEADERSQIEHGQLRTLNWNLCLAHPMHIYFSEDSELMVTDQPAAPK